MDRRIMIFTGKGGVGKTSVAASHAVKSADEGVKTLLISTDMAHNLGDLFGVSTGREPYKITDNLDIYEIDANYVMENDYADITSCISKMMPGSEEVSAEEFGIMTGMEELFSLLKIKQIYDEEKYKRIIVDCAPTGETLSLLKFPELLSWYMEKLFPIGKLALRVLSPVSKKLMKVELPNKKAMSDIEKLYEKLIDLQELFKNRDVTSVRIVTIPEKMVVEETKRNYMYMNLYNYNVDGLYINRVLPHELDNQFFSQWKEIQQKYIKEIKESFGNLPMNEIPWYDEEMDSIEGLRRICRDALSDNDIFEVKEILERESFEMVDDGYTLKVIIPGISKDELDIYQSQTDVVIKVDNFKRNIPLPNILRKYIIDEANLENGQLLLHFAQGDE